ncbi:MULTISPECIES: 4-hydroxybenzoate octaprenyltransferase [unclassified Wenzhouxiangella]|uniref:4-hydroxybenzoate octaprenyltransferase n=1 Tax=unclassified Wenzhouxiangella TaxID=2613841 RepID=UPI000E32C8B0|nr:MULTISPECIES: 4-hydroxybenzoate octaprenyltransferase [unclassified Wenzhouxiangella]RFF26913.1 4-hydroxybenzoate octaprenyltransferase [Wenzhouxiangella sp. 15181]RFP68013.1 4-hydroxybenzoate octaprenyltransferase [Wenzhouxiangella sp. 15190]
MEFRLRARIFSSPAGPWLRLMRFDRPIGIALLLWPTWWGLWFAAGGVPSIKNLVIFTLGVIVMRAAGCVINDYADRDLDPHVQRTVDRPIAAGEIAARHALMLFFGLLLIAFMLVLLTNQLTILMAFFGALLAATYPFFKRFTHFPQLVLGASFSWAIPMAFAAEAGQVPALAWWLFAANFVWTVIFDTEYAMADRDDDLKVGVKSTAIAFGRADVPILGALMGVMTALLLTIGLRYLPHPAWFTAVALVFLHFQLQLWRIRERDPAACFRTFLSNHWVGLFIWLGAAVALWGSG